MLYLLAHSTKQRTRIS